jgi:hypothetical protein
MKKSLLALTILPLLIAGCESLPRSFHETYYLDREWGQAQMNTWDSQIIKPDPAAATKIPDGLSGTNSEQIMKVYREGYGKPPDKTPVFSLGLTSVGTK